MRRARERRDQRPARGANPIAAGSSGQAAAESAGGPRDESRVPLGIGAALFLLAAFLPRLSCEVLWWAFTLVVWGLVAIMVHSDWSLFRERQLAQESATWPWVPGTVTVVRIRAEVAARSVKRQ